MTEMRKFAEENVLGRRSVVKPPSPRMGECLAEFQKEPVLAKGRRTSVVPVPRGLWNNFQGL